MKRLLPVGRSVLMVLLLALPAARAAESDNKGLIKAGESIGQVYIGMEVGAMGKLLGKPTESDAAMGRATEAWFSKPKDGPEQEMIVSEHGDTNRDHWFVEQVVATSPFFHTALGNSTRSDLLVIWREFPNLHYAAANSGVPGPHLELYDDVDTGVAILVERNPSPETGAVWGRCRAMIVHRPGEHARFVGLGRTAK